MSFGKIKITSFGKRHFDPKFSGTKITDKTPEYVEIQLGEEIENGFIKTIDGYAPFCKLIAIDNFTNAKVGSMRIDMSNYQYIRHGYSSRTEQELAVLSRWFELPIPAPLARCLVFVVYSRAQLLKEHKATEKKKQKEFKKQNPKSKYVPTPFEFESDKSVKWGVVAILGQTHNNEEPMQPQTMMRNALGPTEGGSGVPLDREKYLESVEFWSKNAIVKS